MSRLAFLALCSGVFAFPAAAATDLVPVGALWRYFDDLQPPPTNWFRPDFDDLAWKAGAAQLGYGEGDETTEITSGPTRPVTTYFRHSFVVSQSGFFDTVTLRLLRDDGAVVYLNGTEIYRSNMPEGFVSHETPAAIAIGGGEEDEFFQFGVWPYYISEGENTIAVEVHQAAGGLDDCSFDLTLIGNLPLTPPTVTIVSPPDGETSPPGDVYLLANASDLDGHIYQVNFYTNAVLLAFDDAPPFEFLWRNAPEGRYRITAEAYDNSGRRGYSAPVHLQVGTNSVDRVLRGPFLQMGTPTNILVRWRTDWFMTGRIAFGTNTNALNRVAVENGQATEHAVRLDGLLPDTIYYYAILDAMGEVLAGGWDYFFRTAPATNRPVRVWAIGDFGTADYNAEAVRDAYATYAEERYTDVWLMLGDNAYETGTDQEYQRAVFDMYPRFLRQTGVWPTIGNHDASSTGAPGEFPYLDIFTLPTAGEAGGVTSGTERYYSFDYGNVHFICLDSQSSPRQPHGAMARWLEADLAATDKNWIVAFWHHPPYSWGTHNSDYEFGLVEMRRYIVPLLDEYGVDLTLTGHSHNYERTFLISGYYGDSKQLHSSMILDGGFGREDADGPYAKPAGGLGANRGSVHVVCGCSGQGGLFPIDRHPAMRMAMTGFGSLVLDIDGDRLDLKFIRETGEVDDYFTIVKSANPGYARPEIQISRSGEKARLSWPTARVPFAVEESGATANWDPVKETPQTIGRWHYLDRDFGVGRRFYRLRSN